MGKKLDASDFYLIGNDQSLPSKSSLSSRLASLLSFLNCLSISALILFCSFCSSLRQHAILSFEPVGRRLRCLVYTTLRHFSHRKMVFILSLFSLLTSLNVFDHFSLSSLCLLCWKVLGVDWSHYQFNTNNSFLVKSRGGTVRGFRVDHLFHLQAGFVSKVPWLSRIRSHTTLPRNKELKINEQ